MKNIRVKCINAGRMPAPDGTTSNGEGIELNKIYTATDCIYGDYGNICYVIEGFTYPKRIDRFSADTQAEVKELTLSEISRKLGYEVKVIK